MNTTKQKLDLNEVKKIIFKDLGLLLENLDLDWDLANNNVFMPCPIHGGDNPTGVSVSLIHKKWKCWTHNCHEEFGTDIFGFVRGCRQDPTFSDTLRFICSIYNVSGNNKCIDHKDKESQKTELEEIVSIFKNHNILYNNSFTENVPTVNNSLYFEKRGFLPDTLDHFGVKDCIDKTSAMFNRSIIPVYFQNEQVAYIARATKNFIQPKYLFSKGFKKTDYLYNYDEAVKYGPEKHTLFLVEGQGDVWKLYEAGVKNAVGLFGKDISHQQIRLLVQTGVTYIVVLTDNDQAGREGRMKIQRELSRMFNLIYPPMPKKDIGDMSIQKIQKHILSQVEGLY